jgi:hypothetical protein
MTNYAHSSGSDYRVVCCIGCGDPLNAIYDPDIRDTCSPCGGTAKVDRSEARDEIRRGIMAKVREARSK